MPFALSTIGPYVSMARMYPVVVSSPSPASAMPYAASARLPAKIVIDARMVSAIAMIAQTEDSSPEPSPVSSSVAGPVLLAYAISETGSRSTCVKISVTRPMTSASTMPVRVARKKR